MTTAAIPASAAEAKAAGLTYYFSGKPCKQGHVEKRWAASRMCEGCRVLKAEYDRTRRPEYAARKKVLRKGWRKKEIAATIRRKKDPKNWPLFLLRSARHRAKKSGQEFSISEADIFITEICPVLGVRMEMGDNGGKWRMNSPSLDRVDNSRGYVPGNVRVISYRANMLKRDATLAEIRGLLAYMEGHK